MLMKTKDRLPETNPKRTGNEPAGKPLFCTTKRWKNASRELRTHAKRNATRLQIHAERARPVVAVGGTVLYLKCWYDGLFEGPSADPTVRAAIRQRAAAEGTAALHAELTRIDPVAAQRIHPNDLRRIERALEVYQLTGQPISAFQNGRVKT